MVLLESRAVGGVGDVSRMQADAALTVCARVGIPWLLLVLLLLLLQVVQEARRACHRRHIRHALAHKTIQSCWGSLHTTLWLQLLQLACHCSRWLKVHDAVALQCPWLGW